MSGKKLQRISELVKVSAFTKEIILKRECNRFCNSVKNEPDICECGYTRALHSPEALENEFNVTEPTMKTSPTDAFGKLLCVEDEEEDSGQNSIRYVRLDWETDVNSVLELIFRRWKMKQPSVILSVVSDSDRFTDKTTAKLIEWICSRLVEAAASTSSWIITGGLNKGVDKLIGDEVNRKREKQDTNVQAVLGICHWGCLEDTNLLKASSGSYDYASKSNPTGLSLDQHHTHFLLVDDGKQKKSGCEWELRQNVERSLKKPMTSRPSQLIYILIGGGIDSLGFVKKALENEIPVLVATGTGGAADAISTKSKLFEYE